MMNMRKIGITLELTPRGERTLVVVLEDDASNRMMKSYLTEDGVNLDEIERDLERIIEKVNTQVK